MIDSPARFALPLVAGLFMLACGKDEAQMIPLDQPAATGMSPHGTVPTITGEAKIALDSGNKLYAAKSYALALAQYRRAAALAPNAEAPLFGMLMVANVTNDAALTDSATMMLRALNDSATAEEVVDVHSRLRTAPPAQ